MANGVTAGVLVEDSHAINHSLGPMKMQKFRECFKNNIFPPSCVIELHILINCWLKCCHISFCHIVCQAFGISDY